MVAQEILVLLAGVRLPFGVLSGGMFDGRTTDCKSVEFAYSRFDSYTANFVQGGDGTPATLIRSCLWVRFPPLQFWGLLSMAGNSVCIGAMGVRFSPPPPFRNRNSMVRVAAF